MYNDIDILLAPLENIKFNQMKSELKVVEAGHFGKVFIGSKVGIYKDVITNGYDGFLCKNLKDWEKSIKMIIDNPEIFNILSTNLMNTVDSKYTIERWNKKRIEFYKSI